MRGEDCTHFYRVETGQWNDLHCNTKLPYICENYTAYEYPNCEDQQSYEPRSFNSGNFLSVKCACKVLFEVHDLHPLLSSENYRLVRAKRTFKQAEAECRKLDMFLARVDDRAENDFLMDAARKFGHNWNAWIGLHKEKGKGKQWVWGKYCG